MLLQRGGEDLESTGEAILAGARPRTTNLGW